MTTLSHKAARKLRKAKKRSHPPLSLTDRERLRNKIFTVTPSDSWTEHATGEAERAGMRATTQRLLTKLADMGIFPPAGDRVQMTRCARCGHIFPPPYLVGVFVFEICQDCAIQPSNSVQEFHSGRDAKHTALLEILKQAHLKDTEIAALCHRWEGMSQHGIAALMDRSQTWVRQLLLSANAKLQAAGIRLPDPPKPPAKRAEVQFMDTRSLEKLAAKQSH